jgi:hypothetical protein
MTESERQAYFEKYGCYPIENSDVGDGGIVLTQAQIDESESIIAKKQARRYLAETDWYVTRKAETGTAIPDDILTKRAQARLDASD